MIYPDEAMLYAPVEWHDCSEGFEDIRYEKSTDGIAKITINRPQVRNAFRPLTVKEMIQALADARYDDNIGVIILTGAGDKAFCSGGDQKVRGDYGGYKDDSGVHHLNVLDFQRQIRTCPRLTFMVESVATFLTFFRHVEQHGGVARQLLQPRLPVTVGVQRSFQAAQRHRAVLQHFAAPTDGFFFQIRQRYHGVDKAHIQRLFCVVLTAQEPDFSRFFLPDDTSHVGSAPAAVEGTDFRASLTEDGIICCDSQVAHHVQNVTTADGGWRATPPCCST